MEAKTITLADLLKSDRSLLDQVVPAEKTRLTPRRVASLYAILDDHIPLDKEIRAIITEQIEMQKWMKEMEDTFAKNKLKKLVESKPVDKGGMKRISVKLHQLDTETLNILHDKLVSNGFIYNKNSPTGLSCNGQVRNLSGENKLISYFTCPLIGDVRYIVRLKEILYFLATKGKVLKENEVSSMLFHPFTKELSTRVRCRSLESVKDVKLNGVA